MQMNEQLAHGRIQDVFRRFGDTISKYYSRVRELRGDALLAEFEQPPMPQNLLRLPYGNGNTTWLDFGFTIVSTWSLSSRGPGRLGGWKPYFQVEFNAYSAMPRLFTPI
jgi:hypothetical protein